MKAIFNPDGSMFMVGPDHMPIPQEFIGKDVWFPDDMDFRKEVQDEKGNKGKIEVTKEELKQRYDEYLTNYVNARKLAYPSITDQLDILYHGGYDTWRATIEEIKTKYPKP
jgi:L-fucose isomerase-like protein